MESGGATKRKCTEMDEDSSNSWDDWEALVPDVRNTFLKPMRRKEYSEEEDRAILEHIKQEDAYDEVKGRLFWQEMESAEVCPGKTWQSLKEHFLKKLIPNIHKFGLTEEEQAQFLQRFPPEQVSILSQIRKQKKGQPPKRKVQYDENQWLSKDEKKTTKKGGRK